MKIACLIGVTAYAWIAASSALLLLLLGHFEAFTFPYAQWFWLAPYYNELGHWGSAFVIGSGLAPAIVPIIPLAGSANRQPKQRMLTNRWLQPTKRPQIERGVTDNHGHAAEMDDKEALQKFSSKPHPEYGGKVIGRLPSDGTTLYDTLDTGRTGLTIEFSGSGTGKTSDLITKIRRFRGPRVINDPSGEIAPMVWEGLVEYDGEENVHIVSPDPNPKDKYGQPEPWTHLIRRYNPISWIDPDMPMAVTAVRTVARSFFEEESEGSKGGDNEYFRKAARSLISAILGDLIWNDDPRGKNLSAMREILSLGPDTLQSHLESLRASSPCPMTRLAIGPMLNSLRESGKTFSSVWDEANQATMWLTDPNLAEMVSGSDFDTSAICDPTPKSIIFHLPLDLQQTDPAVARVLFGSLVSAKIASKTTNWALFLPDEPWAFGRAKWMETAIAAGRKHGIAMHAPWLDVGTLERVWGGKSARSFWFSNARAILISQLNDPAIARELADACGTYGVLARSEGTNRGVQGGTGFGRVSRGSNVSIHEIKRPVRMLHELIQDLERDDLLVLGIGKPLPLKRAVWMGYPDLRREIEPSPYDRRVA
jgi:type IV secretion system protein VirD4